MFEAHGLEVVVFDPTQLRAAGDRAGALVGDRVRPLDAVFRFFPAEWSCRLPDADAWFAAAARPATLWSNPLATVLTQSKRFPLTWRFLESDLSTWKRLLPETREPLLANGAGWVLKPALGHEGYDAAIAGVTAPERARRRWWKARLRPWRWVAQRDFRAMAIETPDGARYPSVGVFVVDGQPAGAYGRLAVKPLVDDLAQDVVVLLQP